SGKTIDALSMIADITPTVLGITGTPQVTPDVHFTGRSLLPIMHDSVSVVYANNEAIGMEAAAQKALFKGDYKLVNSGPPYGDGIWRLYNLKRDPGETNDLASSDIGRFKEMMADYEEYKLANGVLEMPEGYETLKEVEAKFKMKVKKAATPWIIGIGLILLGLFIRRKIRKKTQPS
ncbi:MAG: arylsulfatase A-like enzyme, partial [Saprospiraceae bacterium]